MRSFIGVVDTYTENGRCDLSIMRSFIGVVHTHTHTHTHTERINRRYYNPSQVSSM